MRIHTSSADMACNLLVELVGFGVLIEAKAEHSSL